MEIRRPVLLLALLLPLICGNARAEKEYRAVTVADPYLELHTGPGRGYPIFHAVERGEPVEILKRKTEWFKVRTESGREGWVHADQMELTLDETGQPARFARLSRAEFLKRRWEMGALSGDFGGASILSAYGGFSLNGNLSVELWGSQILGNFSDGWMVNAAVVHQTWPEWRLSPFFTLGTGVLHTEPKATLVQSEDRTDQVAVVGAGVRAWLTRRFIFRAEYKSYVAFTSRDDNEEIEEWKLGFGFYF